MVQRKMTAAYIEPMLLLRKEKLPEGAEWLYEIKAGRVPRSGDQDRAEGPASFPQRQ
jgi:hypothetical protein